MKRMQVGIIGSLLWLVALMPPTAEAVLYIKGGDIVYDAEHPLNVDAATYLGAAAVTTETTEDGSVSFTNGQHSVWGIFKMGSSDIRQTRKIEMNVTGADTVLCVSNFQASATGTDKTSGGPFREEVCVTDGARLTVSNGLSLSGNVSLRQKLSVDDATLEVLSGKLSVTGPGSLGANCITAEVNFAEADVSVPVGEMVFGASGYDWNGLCSVTATGTTFQTAGLSFYHGSQGVFENCTFSGLGGGLLFAAGMKNRVAADFLFKDSTIPSVDLFVGKSVASAVTPHPAKVVIDGGAANFRSTTVGWVQGTKGDYHPGWLVITNGAQVVWESSDKNVHNVGYFATGRVDIVGAEVRVAELSGGEFRIGYGGYDYSYGELNVGPGGLLDNGAMNIRLGCGNSGIGVLDVCGGTVKGGNLRVSDGGKRAEPSVARIRSSGLVDLSAGGQNAAVWLGTGANCSGSLCLDGGVLVAQRIYSSGVATFEADGGTIRPSQCSTSYPLIGSLTTAVVGAGGLTLDVAFDGMYLDQAFADKAGESGVVTKTGVGDFELRTTGWTVSETVVAKGSLTVKGSSVAAMGTALVVTNGATFSISDSAAQTLTLDALTVRSGTLLMDIGDKIVVNGAADLSGLTIRFSSKPAEDDVRTVIEAGSFTEGSVNELKRALARALGDLTDTYGRFEVTTVGGKTAVSYEITREVAPLSAEDETVWQVGSSDWNQTASWNNGVPAKGKKAVFPAAGAEQIVAVPASAPLTAVAFGSAYTLTGGPLAFQGSRGELELIAQAGESVVSSPLALDDLVDVRVSDGASVRLAGKIDGGSVRKTGAGRLTLAATNDIVTDVVLNGGLTTVETSGAFGQLGVVMKQDTLEVNAPAGEETVLGDQLKVGADGQYKSVIVKTDTPAAIRKFVSTQGGFIKRGTAPLTIEVHDGDVLTAKAAGKSDIQGFATFPANGVSPDNTGLTGKYLFSAFSVAEGEVIVRPAAGETLPTVDASADVTYLALKNTNGTVRAHLTVDGVVYDAGGKTVYVNGYNSGNPYDSDGHPVTLVQELLKGELAVVNGGKVTLGKLALNSFGNKAGMSPTLALTNGTVEASGDVQFSYSSAAPSTLVATSVAWVKAKDSTLTTETKFYNMFTVDGDFDNCTFEGPSFEFDSGSAGRLVFRNGSVFEVPALTFANFRKTALKNATMKLVFDDAEWRYGTGDYTFDPAFPNGSSDDFVIELQGAGLKLAPASGTVFETRFPFVGEGGLTVVGDGTVRFATNTLSFAGALTVASGTLDLTLDSTALDGRTLKGVGKVKGGRFADATLDAASSSLTFDGTAFECRLYVDFGRTSANPIDPKVLSAGVVLGSYEGDPVQLPTVVRAVNTGHEESYRGKLTLVNGQIVGTFERLGLVLIVR